MRPAASRTHVEMKTFMNLIQFISNYVLRNIVNPTHGTLIASTRQTTAAPADWIDLSVEVK